MMVIQLYCILSFFIHTGLATLYSQFCATISSTQADGAVGYVALQIQEGSAALSINLNLANYPLSSSCDATSFAKGLKYHIHSYWNNATASSSANGYCGKTYTGDHYDPNFACSASSQSASTDCPLLNRTTSAGYTYACNTTNYAAGLYSTCEVGDWSGKNGLLQPTTTGGLDFVLPLFVDYLPAYAANYNQATKNSLPWKSVVFHCPNSANTRLVCAEFSATSLAACQSAFLSFSSSSSSSSNDDNVHLKVNTTSFAVITAFVLLAALLLGAAAAAVVILVLRRGDKGGGAGAGAAGRGTGPETTSPLVLVA